GWPGTARLGSKSAGAPPRISRSIMTRIKSPTNIGTSSIEAERLVFGPHPQDRRRGFPRRQTNQARRHHHQRLAGLFGFGLFAEQSPQERNVRESPDP